MDFDEIQRDALTELINIAFGRAASALSKLTGYRVEIETPGVAICAATDLAGALGAVVGDDLASVHQIFSGPVAGDALLILDRNGARTLKRLLTDDALAPVLLDEASDDVLTEIGNILLNACLGTLGNLLNVHVTFSVPRLTVSALDGLIHSLVIGHEELRYALVVHAAFRLRDREVEGYLVIVLTVDSLSRLFAAIRDAEQGE